jgi:tRNA(Arg) A34 adenosine deaminase TadA
MENNNNKNHIWEKCLDLAIESFNAKSLAIASIITNNKDVIVSYGSNQLRDNRDTYNKITLSSIAHAEMNAIHNLGIPGMDGKDFTLYTTVEPCPMCIGAISLSRIKNVVVGSKDPYAGSTQWAQSNNYINSKNIKIIFESGYYEQLFFKLHYLSIKRELQDRPNHRIFGQLKELYGNEMNRIDTIIKRENINTIVLTKNWIEEYL